MTMTRPRSVKYTTTLVRVLPDLAPTWVTTTAGKGHTQETRPRVSRSSVGSSREAMSRPKRRPSGETTTRPTNRWATERPRFTVGTDMDLWAPFVLRERQAFEVSSLASVTGPRRSRSGHGGRGELLQASCACCVTPFQAMGRADTSMHGEHRTGVEQPFECIQQRLFRTGLPVTVAPLSGDRSHCSG